MKHSTTQILSAAVGVGILACVTNAAIAATGGYATTAAPMLIALACGLAIGAAVIGTAWSHQRRTLAILLVVALGAGEAYALLMTAERTLANREAQQVPLRDAALKRTKAEAAVTTAERELEVIGDTPRLKRAIEAKAIADSAAVDRAAEPSCAKNCRALLGQQVAAAAAEVDAARTEIAGARQAAERRFADARAALAEIAMPPSPSPLADRLGIEPWRIDLAAAGLASIAANGLAALLIAFSTHGAPPAPATTATMTTSAPAPIPLIAAAPHPVHVSGQEGDSAAEALAPRDPTAEADKFAGQVFKPHRNGRVRVREILPAYDLWCADRGITPLPPSEIGAALMAIFRRADVPCEMTRGEPEVVGVAWSPHRSSAADHLDRAG